MFIFRTISYLKYGNDTQRDAFNVIDELGIYSDLRKYNPVLYGTIPIEINVKGSDLDIIMEVHDFSVFKTEVTSLYGEYDELVLKEKVISSTSTIKANIKFGGFELELFAQPIPVTKQNAYRHMIIEHYLLNIYPHIKEEIIRLKEQGIKTEPAFAKVLGLEGNPYDELLVSGKEIGVGWGNCDD